MSKKTTRRIFFWSLFLIFCSIAPIVIFYALGYRYNIERGIFVYSGSITLKTVPQEVEIFIDGEQARENRLSFINYSYHIDGIKPGEHLIEVKCPDCQTWSKKAEIHSGISTEFWNVLLIKNSYLKANYNVGQTDGFYLFPSDKKIALVQKESNEQKFFVKILDAESGNQETVFESSDCAFSSDEKENIEWSPQGKKIIIPAECANKKNYFIVDIKSKQTINLAEMSDQNDLKNVRWDGENNNFLFYVSGENLYRIELQNPEEKSLIAENIAGYDFSKTGIYFATRSNGIVYKTSLDGKKSPQQITFSPIENIDAGKDFRIIFYDDDRAAIINGNKDLYIYNKGEKDKYFHKLSSNVSGVHFSNDGKKLLHWDDREIFVYFVRDWDTQPLREENQTKGITRFSEKIKNVQWLNDYEHIIFTVGHCVKVAEIDDRGKRSIMDIMKLNSEASKMIDNISEEKLYFIDTNESGAQTDLYSIQFFENKGLFGLGI